MKVVLILFILSPLLCQGQSNSFEHAQQWKLYDVAGHDLFRYSTDTLRNFSFYSLDNDSIHEFVSGVKELPNGDPPVWMGGPLIVTYELEGATYKIDISHYGGFFFDERTKKYYQVATSDIENWNAYFTRCFVAVHGRH
jgi:hypothetical protein